MSIKNVALVGADGRSVGPVLLETLLADGFKVTVIKRKSSKSPSNYPSEVSVVTVSDEFPVEELAGPLKGQDAVVVTTAGSQIQVQKNLAEAAAQAGVKRFIPADFGSCDSSMSIVQELVPLYKQKTEIRDYLTNLSKKNDKFSWTAVVCGHYFDWSPQFLHVWPKDKRGDMLDDGETKFSTTTLAQTAKATTAILRKPDETVNKVLYIHSFTVNQKQLARAFEKATGSEWKWTHIDSQPFTREQKALADKGDKDAVEELVWILGTLHSNWVKNETFAMDLLGLQDEDLDEVVRKVVAKDAK